MQFSQRNDFQAKPSLAPWREGVGVWTRAGPLVLAHVGFLASLWLVAIDWADVGYLLALSTVRGLGVTVGHHRYLSHRSFRTSRGMQFLLAAWGTSSFQGGPLWWAGHHRFHHRHSDRSDDIHSPRHGLLWSHCGWIFSTRMNRPAAKHTSDLAAFPELVWLDRWAHLPGFLLAGLCAALGGWTGLLFVFCGSTVLVLHVTLSVNSLTHRFGSRRFDTPDDSRNNGWIAFFAFGEGWHNTHHACPVSARHGIAWYEVDATYWLILALEKVGLVWGVKRPAFPPKTKPSLPAPPA
jgi:stearoyl-CoA desaturase (delta-9 desaturase)